MEYDVFASGGEEGGRIVWRAERQRRAGDAAGAAALARQALGLADDASARVALALALLDQGSVDDVRHVLETLFETLMGDVTFHGETPFGHAEAHTAMIPDGTLAAATAATLELVTSFDDASFERAMAEAEAQRELMHDADSVAERVLREVSAEPSDELLPSADSPFATHTFAELLERQGHGAEAETLRSALAGREEEPLAAAATAGPEPGAPDRVRATLERWLGNLKRRAA